MKNDLSLMLSIFVVIVLALFGVHYLYLCQNGFNEQNYIVAFLILLIPSMVIGYIFLCIAFQKLHTQEGNLEHIVRETLHEINLPISTIEVNVSLLKRDEKDKRRLKRLERIISSSRRLKKLHKELSYQIKREIGTVEREVFELKSLIIDEVEHFRDLGFDRFNLSLENTEIFADKIGFEQTIDNILQNALKYSQSDVDITLKDSLLSIKDYGVGMSEDEILNIYQRYYQANSSNDGEGIGLAIVKRYCDENRIELKISSTKGVGTNFYLYLKAILKRKP